MKKEKNIAEFPDAVTERGLRHLEELIQIKKNGFRACMLYIIQRDDVDSFRPAYEIDPNYSKKLQEAMSHGVEVIIYKCRVSLDEIAVYKMIPLID